MADVGDDPGGRLFIVLQEVETLKRSLEEAKQAHMAEVQLLQEKLEEKEANVEFEIVEEKLKLSESELELVVQRAERAEKNAESLHQTVQELESRLAELEKKTTTPVSAAPAPPPPPPPPPPLPPMNGSPSLKLITRERCGERNGTALSDMENMLGINKKPTTVAQQPGKLFYILKFIFNRLKTSQVCVLYIFTLKKN